MASVWEHPSLLLRTLRGRPPSRYVLMSFGLIAFVTGIALITYGLSASSGTPPLRPPPPVLDLGDLESETLRLRNRVPTDAPAASTPTPAPAPPLGEASYRMGIPAIGVDGEVFTYGLDENAVPEVPANPEEIAWYNFSAPPGTGSNAVFAGHVTWNGPAVFYDLQTLQPGDDIKLIGEDGTQLLYRVSANFAVDPADPDALKVMYPTDTDVVTLITCGGTFFATDDPVSGGDYTLRVIVRGDLVGVDRPGTAQAEVKCRHGAVSWTVEFGPPSRSPNPRPRHRPATGKAVHCGSPPAPCPGSVG